MIVPGVASAVEDFGFFDLLTCAQCLCFCRESIHDQSHLQPYEAKERKFDAVVAEALNPPS